ncbi:MAG: bifunctional metallophosphatase/5'-nucleotidase [Sandaracinaceae bacterium]
MRTLASWMMGVVVLSLAGCGGGSGVTTLQIIHSSDNESSFRDPNTLEDKLLNYSAVVEGLQDLSQAEGWETIHVTAGDHVIPGPFFLASDEAFGANGLGDIRSYNAMNLVANGMGNHEFDDGINSFARMLDEADYPFIAVNLDFSSVQLDAGAPEICIGEDGANVTELAGCVVKSAVITLNGEDIGLIGRAPADFFNVIEDPENTLGGLDFVGGRDPDTNQPLVSATGQVNDQVDLLRDQGVEKFILLDHAQDFTGDPLVASELDGIDVIVSAGSTGFFANSNVEGPFNFLRPGDSPEETYPVVQENAEGNPVLVVNTEQLYSYVAQLIITFDDEGNIDESLTDSRSGPVATTEEAIALLEDVPGVSGNLSPAPGVQSVFDDLAMTDLIMGQFEVIGMTASTLNGARADVRTRETNLGRLAADSTLAFAQAQFPDRSVDVALKNGGGIRDTILGPNVTVLTVSAALAFDNNLSILDLTGEQLLAAMENSISRGCSTDGRFPQIAGMEMVWSSDQDPIEGMASVSTPSRVRRLVVGDDVLVMGGQAMVDLSSVTYTMATNSFLATGGDGYAAFEDNPNEDITDTGEQEILINYITEDLEGMVDLADPPPGPRVTNMATCPEE